MKEFDYDIINRYLDEELSPEEIKAFEEQMQQDEDLLNEVELIREINATLKMKLHTDENEIALRRSLKENSMDHFYKKPEPAKIIPLNRRRWMVAAAAVLITALILTVWFPWDKEDLYKQYASIQMPAVAERGAADDHLLRSATKNFNDGKFTEAIPFFESVLKDNSQNSFAKYYYAIALLQSGQTEKSRTHLNELYNGASLFQYDAAFYTALSYLREKDKNNCKVWLNKIPATADAYTKAQELLKKL